MSPYGSTAVTDGRPMVSVPVLSNATVFTRAMSSSAAPPLTRMPIRVAAPIADTIDTGVEITSAQGHAITSSTSALYTHVPGSAENAHPESAIAPAISTTAGVYTAANRSTSCCDGAFADCASSTR